MPFETFKKIFDAMPSNLTQIAFGIGNIYGHDDMWKMFDYCRNSGRAVVPNVTTNGWKLTDEIALKLKQYCGAVAVSRYNPKDVCYDAVKKLTDLGMTQINIHQLVSMETLDACMETLRDIKTDPRLAKLNAIVFLTLKPKGKRNTYNIVSDVEYKKLIDKCLEEKINFGFDSCSANRFLRIANNPKFETVAEPCESTLFSSYINVEGKFFPCSFSEGEGEWTEGLDVVNCKNFITDIWNNHKTVKFRDGLLACKRNCPLFKI
jgi:MoaA/NifB/PqqE/SkfB family radical SAM enzyme